MNCLKESFGENGIFLKKRMALHFSLQKGKENGCKLGSFDLDLEGCSNIARKLALITGICLVIAAFSIVAVCQQGKKKRSL